MGVIAFIGIGSNIHPEENIIKALKELSKEAVVLEVSPHYSTKAYNRPEQDNYINGVWKINALSEPENLKYEVLRNIENKLGRRRKKDKFASRTIDLDLLLYGNDVINNDRISLPDKDIYMRAFICIPLFELEPQLILPDTNRKLADIVKNFDRSGMTLLNDFTEKLKTFIK